MKSLHKKHEHFFVEGSSKILTVFGFWMQILNLQKQQNHLNNFKSQHPNTLPFVANSYI